MPVYDSFAIDSTGAIDGTCVGGGLVGERGCRYEVEERVAKTRKRPNAIPNDLLEALGAGSGLGSNGTSTTGEQP